MDSHKKTVGKVPASENRKIMILYRHPETGFVEPKWVTYDGPIAPKVWERIGKRFLKLDAGGYFWPADGMDAYGAAIQEVELTAARIERGEVVLRKASPVTYLVNTGAQVFLNFHQRKVQPMRQTYRAVERRTMGKGARGEDGFDIDNYDGTQDRPDKTMCDACGETCEESVPVGSALTAQQLVEQMPGIPWASERRDQARMMLGEICATLFDSHPDIVRAFAAYVEADGNFVQAAHLAHIGINRFYREWRGWLATARAVGEKIDGLGH